MAVTMQLFSKIQHLNIVNGKAAARPLADLPVVHLSLLQTLKCCSVHYIDWLYAPSLSLVEFHGVHVLQALLSRRHTRTL